MDMEMLEEVLFASVAWMDTPTLIASIILCLFSAFFSFRFLKLALVISAFYAGYTFGAETVGLGLKDLVPGFDISIIIGILCAIVFALIAVKIYKYFIYSPFRMIRSFFLRVVGMGMALSRALE